MSGAKQLMKSEASSLMLIDHETKELFFNIVTGEQGDVLKEARIPLDKGIAGLVAATGESMIINDAENDPRLYRHIDELTKFSTRNLICVPLIVEDHIFGVLEVLNKINNDSFSQDDLDTLKSFSEFAALAINQRNLYQKMENKAYETSVLYRLCETINECDTIDDLLQENIRIVCEALQSDRVSIIAREGDAFVFMASVGIPPKVLKNRKVSVDGNILEYMIQTESGVVSANIHEDERFKISSPSRYKNNSFVATPLKLRSKIVAFLCVTERKKKMPYQQWDLRLLEMIAQQIMENYLHSQLTEEFKNKQKMEAELAITARMQHDILPTEFPADGQLDIAACNIPAKIVGGDFYDFLPLDQGKYGVIIADVAGKGVPAGLFMAISRSTIRVHFAHTLSPAKILELANKHIFADSRSGMFVTCFCCILDTQKKEISYSNAGHYVQYLVKSKTGRIMRLQTPGKPLGVLPKETYQEKRISYDPDDVLVLYTDGVTEAVNTKNEEYGERRLKTKIRSARGSTSESIMKLIIADINKHQGTSEPFDDITLMIVKLKDPQRMGAKLRVVSQLQNVRVILNEADRILKAANAGREQSSDVLTSVDEAFANIVHHGYENRSDGVIDVDMVLEKGVFCITFTDEAQQGVPPPLQPVLGRALLDKKGNLGIGRYLIHNLMDDVQYERVGIQNRLTIKKQIA
jgi:serine phosphatase RsbU (regulator of sigma subunit)/anti-sigma regulatory factor (Ser/Thr protein kinase)/putative methionine-R-sulfoxide reductase with GAF domain